MKVTGSKLHRVWKCPASAVLPQVERDHSKHEPARARGHAIHRFLERVREIGRGAALAEAPADLLPLLEALDLDNLPVGLACEVAFAWNWKAGTARELGRSPNLPLRPDGGIDYDVLGVDWSCEIPCTLDVVGVAENLGPGGHGGKNVRGYVGDYKSGHSKYPAPDLFAQTLLGALCVARLWKCDDVVVELIHIHDAGTHHAVRRTVTDWDLDVFEREIARAMEIVGDRQALLARISCELDPHEVPTPVEGSWCEHCDAYKSCPAKVALVRAIPAELAGFGIRPDPESGALTLTAGALTVRNASLAWMALERIEDVIARAKEEICGIGAFEEIPLPDGRVIGRLVTERRSIAGRIGAEVLEQRYGRATRDEFVELSVTMTALRQAAQKHIQKGEKLETRAKDGVYDKLLAEVERRGGVELKVTDAVRPHVPKKKRLPSG